MKTALLVIALALCGVWLFLRRRRALEASAHARAVEHDRRTQGNKSDYHAVSIRFSADACPAAKDLEGYRFLANAAPRLPLPGCEENNCACRFQHYSDRRSGHDRRSPFASGGAAAATGKFELERRQGDERRAGN